ncbi:MAG: hypothetical protein QME52_06405, partial [Bacteroidota bacterium]|nr:hypothetical protein [Bacteroidota bacterium]
YLYDSPLHCKLFTENFVVSDRNICQHEANSISNNTVPTSGVLSSFNFKLLPSYIFRKFIPILNIYADPAY